MDESNTTFKCLHLSDHHIECDGVIFEKHETLTYDELEFWLYFGGYVGLVLLAGMMSGLTLAVFSLDLTSLKVLLIAGNDKDKKYAKRIMPLVARQYLVLCSLVLANSLAVEAMPVLLDTIANPIVAIATSVSAVLIFGEVIPQAVCGRYGLAIGYYFSWLVWTVIAALFIVSWPLSMILECLLGKNRGTFYRRAELKALIDIHGPSTKPKKRTTRRRFNFLTKKEENETVNEKEASTVKAASLLADAQMIAAERLTIDEVLIIRGALELSKKYAKDVMVKLNDVYMLSTDDNIDGKKLVEILELGHSRIPVYKGNRKDNIAGVLLTKRMITADPNISTPVKELIKDKHYFYPPFRVDSKMSLYDLLNKFQEGKSTHMSFVYERKDDKSEPMLIGVITLEDIIEELLLKEILDETDILREVNRKIQLARAKAAKRLSNGDISKQIVVPSAGNNVTATGAPAKVGYRKMNATLVSKKQHQGSSKAKEK